MNRAVIKSFRLKQSLLDRIEEACEEQDLRFSEFIIKAVESYLDNLKKD